MGASTDSPGHFESTKKRAAFSLAVRGDLGVRGNTMKRISLLCDFDHDHMAARKASALESDPSGAVPTMFGPSFMVRLQTNHFLCKPYMWYIMATEHGPRSFGYLAEPALPLLLATLWGASYTFIKLGVESIPPVTLIAARDDRGSGAAGRLEWRRIAAPTDLAVWRRFLFQACFNSVIPFALIAWLAASRHRKH